VSPKVFLLLGLAAFWALLRVAVLQQPGYELSRDTISSLASQGAVNAWIGVLAFATGGLGTIGLSFLLRRISQPAGLALGLAGVALLIVGVTRINCLDGAAGCLMRDATDAWTGRIHLAGTVLYEVAFLGSVASAALCIWRAGSRAAPLLAMLGLLSSILFFAVLPVEIGLGQRAWLLVHTVLIAGLLFAPRGDEPVIEPT